MRHVLILCEFKLDYLKNKLKNFIKKKSCVKIYRLQLIIFQKTILSVT